MIKKSKKDIDDQQKKLKERIEKILKSPNINDSVFKMLQKVFSHKSPLTSIEKINKGLQLDD